jgi:hypothetical protein
VVPAGGFNIVASHLPLGPFDVVDLVLPELRRRGLFRSEPEDNTPRRNRGPPTPHYLASAPLAAEQDQP